MRDIDITAPGKLLALILVLIGCLAFILLSAYTGRGDSTPAWATLTLVVGYLTGNGLGARRGQITVAPFAPREPEQAS